ncbi:DNA cytosine methyltransferase, partial [bacterium]
MLQDLAEELHVSKFTVVDLFCGAGGLSLGLTRAGFKVLLAIDSWDKAIATYSRNIGTHAQLGSVNYDSTLPVATVFVGGPPCQGFSSAGKRDGSDQRNTLVAVFSRIVAKHQP